MTAVEHMSAAELADHIATVTAGGSTDRTAPGALREAAYAAGPLSRHSVPLSKARAEVLHQVWRCEGSWGRPGAFSNDFCYTRWDDLARAAGELAAALRNLGPADGGGA